MKLKKYMFSIVCICMVFSVVYMCQIKKNRVVSGKEMYRGFILDNVLDGKIHYNLYVPKTYDGTKPYALYVTLPGYEGLYFQGVGQNLKSEEFAFEAQKYNKEMIVVAPQLEDWQETSANQTIKLVKYLLQTYNIDPLKVYANGYSGGAETMSLVLEKEPDLFRAYLHCSSKWDGKMDALISKRVPVYLVVGKNDEYYGSKPTRDIYKKMYKAYEQEGLTKSEIDTLLVLDIKDHSYFTSKGYDHEHGGGVLFAKDSKIMRWLFSK